MNHQVPSVASGFFSKLLELTRVASKGPRTLISGRPGVSLWSATRQSLFDTLNIVYGEEEKRGFVKLNAISLLFAVGGILFVVACARRDRGHTRRSGRHLPLRAELRGAAVAVDHLRQRRHPVARDFGAVLLVRVQFEKFNETYGSLGAVIGFMWISAIVILLGAELDAEMEHQTARDTTTGSPKPMGCGARGWPIRTVRRRATDMTNLLKFRPGR